MQLFALLPLLPLLNTLVEAAPTCNRPAREGAAEGKHHHRHSKHRTRTRTRTRTGGTRTSTRTTAEQAQGTRLVVGGVEAVSAGSAVTNGTSLAAGIPSPSPSPYSSASASTIDNLAPMPAVVSGTSTAPHATSATHTTTTSIAVVAGGGKVNERVATTTTTPRATTSTTPAPTTQRTTTAISTSTSIPRAASSASSASTAAPVAGGTGASGARAGLAMNYESKANVPSFGGHLGWYYSWNLDPLPNTQGLEFVPMVWGADMAQSFSGNVRQGSTHILGFNEPDIGNQYGGSNMPASRAADLHKQWTAKVPAGIKIGSPAVARGGKKWMQDWLSACGGGCKFDFVPYHYYGTDASDLIAYTKDFYNTFNKPLWLTEVACHDYGTNTICNASQVRAFMKTFFDWANSAEGQRMVERWSWFGVFPNHALTNANGLLNTDGTANDMGKYYASF